MKYVQNISTVDLYSVYPYSIAKVVYMLSRYQQQANNNSFHANRVLPNTHFSASKLTVSYELNNYQPLLSHLQTLDDPRWILFIAPPGKPNFQFLQQAGINKSRIITLTQKQLDDPEKIFKNALASNNYSAVIRWVNSDNKPSSSEVNQLTLESNTHCFIFCTQ